MCLIGESKERKESKISLGRIEKWWSIQKTIFGESRVSAGIKVAECFGIKKSLEKETFQKVAYKIWSSEEWLCVDGHYRVWLFEYDGEVDLSNATTDEASQVAWMNRSQIKEYLMQICLRIHWSIFLRKWINNKL